MHHSSCVNRAEKGALYEAAAETTLARHKNAANKIITAAAERKMIMPRCDFLPLPLVIPISIHTHAHTSIQRENNKSTYCESGCKNLAWHKEARVRFAKPISFGAL